ncbi:2OG-Fe(II) oxygenase family protein [Thalassospira alkalitolerans]|uniref:Fe2OG dioxygenase domain-containing protein n=1 Tax=Thalassospira alkalitolerans TaxID=1293890 RepID=A0A1Y2LIZ6_9PROT|nr:2OG-Fe(II) oxygenase [Thalassospira alkalitolerans]OSQ50503.1 hypothetical protein TALK_02740 [Thalassospira alkalitolerans]
MSATPKTAISTSRVAKGDIVPKISLPDVAAKTVDLTDQLIAGNTLALFLLDDKPTKETWQMIDRFLDQVSDYEALTFLIIDGKKSPKKSPKSNAKATELYDLENAVRKLFGVNEPSILLIDPNHRLMFNAPLADMNNAIDVCKAIHAGSKPDLASRQAPVMLLHDILEPELCEALLAYWQAGEKRADGVSQGAENSSTAKSDIKKRNDVVLLDEVLFEKVKTRIVTRILPELFKAFQFRTASMEVLRIGCYDAADQGHFGRHRDNRTAFTAHRRFAVSLNLNPITYEGGQVRFPEYGRGLYAPPAGGAVIFSCSLLHEAMPVTKGRRFGIFTFLTDEAGAIAEQKMIAQRKGQIAPLAMKR